MSKLYIDREKGNGIEEVKGVLFIQEDGETMGIVGDCNSEQELMFLMENIINLKEIIEGNNKNTEE